LIFGDKEKSFDQLVSEATANKTLPPLLWFLMPYTVKETGQFTCAVIVQGRAWDDAVKAALHLRIEDRETFGKITEIPADRVPAEQYRNRVLTLEEIRTIWPTQKEGTN
jgi:hypothetical protein